ncbi:MAG: GGDEF domain-containing protein [Sphaerochaetaceae bacterium]|nr:GGDEF domain-containing protein [Sphaerochaetaceae bacterium]
MDKKKKKASNFIRNGLHEYAYGGVDRDFFEKNRLIINERNIEMIEQFSLFISLILFSLIAVSFFSTFIEPFRVFNISYFIVFTLMYFVSKKIKDYNEKSLIYLSYLFMLTLVSLAFYLGIFIDPKYPFFGLFFITQIILPIIILDTPYRLFIFLVLMTAAFDILLSIFNPSEYLNYILFQTIIYCMVGTFINYKVVQLKLNDTKIIKGVELERDTDSLIQIDSRSKLTRDLETFEIKQIKGIMMIDIDNFKNYNDDYGHQMGDFCLKSVGKKLQEFDEKFKLKSARYGGEEFIAYSTFHSEEEFSAIAKNLVKEIYDLNMNFEKSKYQRITISLGYTTIKDNPETKKQYISFADTALYLAKALGKNRAVSYNKS